MPLLVCVCVCVIGNINSCPDDHPEVDSILVFKVKTNVCVCARACVRTCTLSASLSRACAQQATTMCESIQETELMRKLHLLTKTHKTHTQTHKHTHTHVHAPSACQPRRLRNHTLRCNNKRKRGVSLSTDWGLVLSFLTDPGEREGGYKVCDRCLA